MTTALIIIAIAVAVGIILWMRRRKKSAPDFTQVTHGGVRIASPVTLPAVALDAIDEGIQTQIDKATAAHPDWTEFDNLADYEIKFIAPQAINNVNDPGSPAIIVQGIQAAGTVDYTGYPTIILPYQANWDFLDYLKRAAQFESEHVRLWGNNKTLFYYFTGSNDVHPIFP